MAVAVEKPPEAAPPRGGPVRSARSAWFAVAMTVVGFAVAIALFLTISDIVGFDVMGTGQAGWGDALVIMVPVMVASLVAPGFGVMLGARAARSGNRSGAVAAGIAAATGVVLIVWEVIALVDIA